MGLENLAKSTMLIELLKNQREAGKLYNAICASPALVLQPHKLLEWEKATCYVSFKDILGNAYEDKNVVVSNNLSKILFKI